MRLMSDRSYGPVPIEKIKVLNSRNREQEQFKKNVQSIRDVGLLKPVVVNRRHLGKTGYYELVCGEGRYLAYKQLGRPEIPAEVLDCDRNTALLYSLVENIARVPPGTMWFAREVTRMHDAGWTLKEISKVVCMCESYVRDYIRLAEQGEERLIKGVEQGLFNMSFALMVARSDSATIQNVLMDAFDKGMVNSSNLPTVRKLVEARLRSIRSHGGGNSSSGPRAARYSVEQLRGDITKVTKEKESFVHEVGIKENRLMTILQDLATLWQSKAFVALVKVEELDRRPTLKGTYHV